MSLSEFSLNLVNVKLSNMALNICKAVIFYWCDRQHSVQIYFQDAGGQFEQFREHAPLLNDTYLS